MKLLFFKDIFISHTFWPLFSFHFKHLSHGQWDQNKNRKSAQKLMKSNKSFNGRLCP